MDPSTVFRPRGEYVAREIGGEMILVPVRSGVAELDSIFTLNEVGAVIWEGVVRGNTLEEIVAAVVTGFEVDEEPAFRDAVEFLESLRENGVVEIAGD